MHTGICVIDALYARMQAMYPRYSLKLSMVIKQAFNASWIRLILECKRCIYDREYLGLDIVLNGYS